MLLCLICYLVNKVVYAKNLPIGILQQHRDERRGLGGIFFDDLNDYDQEMLLSFATGIYHVVLDNLCLIILFLLFRCVFNLFCDAYLKFAECANSVIPAYLPIIEKRKDTPFTDSHKAWQQLRRGRYVEFNLVCCSQA